jgi:hypothetical protein
MDELMFLMLAADGGLVGHEDYSTENDPIQELSCGVVEAPQR